MQDIKIPSIELLQSFQLINGLGTESLNWLAEQLVPITLEPETPLTQENMSNRMLYFISEGTMAIQKNVPGGKPETIVTLSATTVIGEMSCLLGRAAIATVLAITQVKGWKLDTRELRKAPAKFFLRERLLERILKLVSTRLESTNQGIVKLLETRREQTTLTIQDIDQFTESWKAGLAFSESYQDLDESWSFK